MRLSLHLNLIHFIWISRTTGSTVIPPKLTERQLVSNGESVGGPIDYQVLMQHDGVFQCGGVLIASDVVLTTIDACSASSLDSYEIHLGVYDRSMPPPMVRSVVQEVKHPDYDFFGPDYDVMILKLNEPATGYTPIRLNFDNSIPAPDDVLDMTGWGEEFPNSGMSNVLQTSNITYVDSEICSSSFESGFGYNPLGESEMCLYTFFKTPCDGDFGGPIVIDDDNGDPLLVGLMSWTWECGGFLIPTLAARVSAVSPWIQSTLCDDSVGSEGYDFCENLIEPSPPVPTPFPTRTPTIAPTPIPTKAPTTAPIRQPTKAPTATPIAIITKEPISFPTSSPTKSPTPSPTDAPTPPPTKNPTPSPTDAPTSSPTRSPTAIITTSPSPSPTGAPTFLPTRSSIAVVTKEPTTESPMIGTITIPTRTSSRPTLIEQNTIEETVDSPSSSPEVSKPTILSQADSPSSPVGTNLKIPSLIYCSCVVLYIVCVSL
mmetsp:Transcript_12274/g.16028  ORF Transcript_12274/g.16028 Transcript_12274/m.16028 type:complete len:487 (-) Transcript_12274:2066-3526(-)